MAFIESGRWLRPLCGAATGILIGLFVASPAVAAGGGGHREAMAALNDLRAALSELKRASNITDSDPAPYKAAAQRALNAVAGKSDDGFVAAAGNPGDDQGALGHLATLLGNAHGEPWVPAVKGAWVNANVAESRLLDTVGSKELDDFQVAMSGALEALDVAIGRDSDTDTLGGLQGALATTALGVPDGGKIVSGCAVPASAPAYGVSKGYLLYVAVPNRGNTTLPQSLGIGSVSAGKDFVVLHTAAAAMTAKLCPQHAEAAPHLVAVRTAAANPPKSSKRGGGVPKLYTEAQAEAGKKVAKGICAACHGKDLQGGSGPAIAGTAFLKKAQALDWTVGNLRTIVLNTMPRNNPGSLTPKQYADVLAYLLAANCYPAGKDQFPTKSATAALKHAALKSPPGVKPENAKLGTCPLRTAMNKGAQTIGTK